MATLTCVANVPQAEFLNLPNRFCAFVGGFGSGKTHALAMGICANKWAAPKVLTSYYAPTFKHVKRIFYPKIEAVAHSMGLKAKIKIGNNEVQYYNGRQYRGTTLCDTMENPSSIVGTEAGRIAIDELDILSANNAEMAWNKIIGRARASQGIVANRVDVGTTPEGYKFVYNRFKAENRPDYAYVEASTFENEANLPPGYIQSLLDTYPEYLIKAYLEGKFTNLTSGTVYRQYDRKSHNSVETIMSGEPLYIGQDFNVCNMASCVFVKRDNGLHAVDQLVGVYDTPSLIKTIASRYGQREIFIYPDASGKNRATVDASMSDIALLKQAGFIVRVNLSNPSVKDRVLSINLAFDKGLLWINSSKCKDVVDTLEKHAYDKNGEPDKSSGYDHMGDALGYVVVKEYPIKGRPGFVG
jgi:hypothetical protein